MNLIIDAGNTQIKWAVYSGLKQLAKNSVSNWESIDPGSLASDFPGIRFVILSSVRIIPESFFESIKQYFNEIVELNYRTILPLKIKYKTPETLGNDRIAAAIGGAALFPGNSVLVIDIGTAITIDLVNEKSEFIGGNISPGMRLRYKALNDFTDDLPLIAPTDNPPFIGQTTAGAIQAGVQTGILYELDAYINALMNKYNKLRVILTGGDAPYFVKNLKNTIFVVPDLVLDGLNLILEFHKGKLLG